MVVTQYQKYYHQWLDRGDILRANARYLQVQLRRRFRVAVDRHLYTRLNHLSSVSGPGDGHYSSIVKRCLNRLRDFRKTSLSSASSTSSSALSRIKRVKQQIYAEEESAIARMLQAVAVPVLGNVCHVFMHGLNRVQIYGAEKLVNALKQKSIDKPLVTVSNHIASVDDPLVIASLLPPSVLMDAQNLRWTLCASDRCFKNPVTSAFFKSVKVLPVSRGDGIYQKGLDMAISKLNSGGWVHIFPEGSRSRDGGKTVRPAKRGVGRLVVDADNTPMVVPFVHTGMQDIMPIGAKFPRIGKTVTVIIGDPMEFEDLLNDEGTEFASRGDFYDAVSSRIGERLQQMKVQVDNLALEQSHQMQDSSLPSFDQAAGIVTEQVKQNERVNTPHQEPFLSEQTMTTRFADDRGPLSRMQSSIDSTELLGFAARGIFHDRSEISRQHQQLSPLRAWKQLLEANYEGRLCTSKPPSSILVGRP